MMRAMRPLVLLLLAAVLTGCSGFSIGPRQDKDDATAFDRLLAGKGPGAPFAARELLGKRWERMWVFEDGTATQAIEDRIGIPFPQSGERPMVEGGRNYVVFDDGEVVVSAFVPSARVEVRPACVAGGRRAIGPRTRVVVVPAGGGEPRRLSTQPPPAGCG
jgi:hypothetical protein